MRLLTIALGVLVLAGCSSTKLIVVNTSGKPIKNVEIKLGDKSTPVALMADGESHTQSVSVETPLSVNVFYQNESGNQFYTSSPIELKKGEGGSLRLSVTAKGTLEAVKTK